ncbi:MAG: molybdopterin-dependent oxidoreductase [Deltaproteobacteria bacterium]|nr:molybdopterin-dependent oxidoreductase [Deltaproteobacteria bacterium]
MVLGSRFVLGRKPGISNFHLLTEARYNGARVVCIAPDYSASAIHADLWVPLNIGSDAALALSMCEVIVSERLFKEDFVREQTDLSILVRTDNGKFLREGDLRRGGRDDLYYFWDLKTGKLTAAPRDSLALGEAVPALEGRFRVAGSNGEIEVRPVFELLRQHLRAYTPEAAARVTGVSAEMIRTVAREIARARAVSNVSTFNWGKFYNGHEIERAIILLVALCGQMGRKGAVYNAYTGLAADTLAPGGLVSGWLLLRAAASTDPRYAQWKSQGYTDEMIILEYARDANAKRRVNPSSLFHYFHSGLLELSARNQSWDPSLKRPLQAYVEEALGKAWHHVWPGPDRTPKAVIQFGGSIVHRLRATEHALKTLLPKLELLVTVDTRWGSTALYSDYVLPAAGWYEKFSFYGPLKIDYPYGFIINKAEEPLGESKGEWEIACRVAHKIEERAKARGLTSFNGKRPLR